MLLRSTEPRSAPSATGSHRNGIAPMWRLDACSICASGASQPAWARAGRARKQAGRRAVSPAESGRPPHSAGTPTPGDYRRPGGGRHMAPVLGGGAPKAWPGWSCETGQ